jgi:type IX secretion system PorP/SprF family membrane protein
MKRILIIGFLGVSAILNAQQLPQFTQFANNQSLYNPAFIGINKSSDLTVGGRWQMLGFGNEPRTAFGIFSKNIKLKEKEVFNPALRISRNIPVSNSNEKRKFSHASGAQIMLDQYGAFRSFNLNGIYAFHYQANRNMKVSGGVKVGFSNNSFDASKAIVSNITDPKQAYQGGDSEYDQFISGRQNATFLNIGVGTVIHYSNFFIGFSADQLTRNTIELVNSSVNFNPSTHYFFTTGYKLSISEALKLTAVAQIKKMKPAPISTEFSIIANYGESLFCGLNYRHKAAVGAIAGFHINEKFSFGYSLDFTVNKLNYASNGGHELILSYRF